MTTRYISDTHFHHAKIIDYCQRPFLNVDEMDRQMIVWWNSVVREHDIVWHLGDVGMFKNAYAAAELRRALNGSIRVVPGNHDDIELLREAGWDVRGPLVWDDTGICLCHYPLDSWVNTSRGKSHYKIHLHGHAHGAATPKRYRLDVGVDVCGYWPLTYAEVGARALTPPEERGISPGYAKMYTVPSKTETAK